MKACRSVAQALTHEGKGDATCTEGLGDPQERVMQTYAAHPEVDWTGSLAALDEK